MGKAAVTVSVYAIGNFVTGMAVSLRFVASSLSEAKASILNRTSSQFYAEVLGSHPSSELMTLALAIMRKKKNCTALIIK